MTSVNVSTVATLGGHTGEVRAVSFRPDGDVMAIGDERGVVTLWDVADPAHPVTLSTLTVDPRAIYAVRFAPDGQRLAVGTGANHYVNEYVGSYYDGAVCLCDVSDPTRATRLWSETLGRRALSGIVHALAFTRDGRCLVTSGVDRFAFVWDITDPARPTRLAHLVLSRWMLAGSSFAMEASPHGRLLAVGMEGRASLWDIADPARPRMVSILAPKRLLRPVVAAVAFHPDGRLLAHGVGRWLLVWDIADPARPRPVAVLPSAHRRVITTVAYRPDGRVLLSGSSDRTLIVWSTERPPMPLATIVQARPVHAVAFSPRNPSLFAVTGGRGMAGLHIMELS